MRAVVHPRYGAPDVLEVADVARPVVAGADDVLVRVHAAGLSIADHHVVTGKPYLIRLTPFGGLPRPRNRVPGMALSGVVEAVGNNVTTLRPGDAVFGEALTGAFAEYVVVPAARLAPKPVNLSLEDAAAAPWGVTALQGLVDVGGLVAGQKVLINGASGGVGTWAVQIAKALGAEVTAVCSTRNVERMRALGADHVVDYTQSDFTAVGARYDLLFDAVGNRSLAEFRSVLVPKGTYVSCGGTTGDWVGPVFAILKMLVTSLFTTQKLTSFITSTNHERLVRLTALIEAGQASPVIEHRCTLPEVAAALRHVGSGHTQGQTIIRIAA